MSKYNHRCPFCKENIPKFYITRTVNKKRRHKNKTRIIKEVIGEDWSSHASSCKKLNEFLNKTK